MNKTSKQNYPSVGMARPHWLCCQSQPVMSALYFYFCPSLSQSLFLCFERFIGASISTSAPQPLSIPKFLVIMSSPLFIPATSLISSPPSLHQHPSFSLCHPYISYHFVSWGVRRGPRHNWLQCPSLCVRMCVCGHVFSVSTSVFVCVHFHHADVGWDGYQSFLLRQGQHFCPAPHSRKRSDKLILIGFWFASKWGAAAS